MAIQDGVNGAASRDFHFARQSSEEALPDLAGAPVWFLALGRYDGRFDLFGQLVGIAVGAPGTIREPLQSALLVTLEDLVAGFAGNLKLAAQRGHAFAVLEPNHESYAFVHNRTFLPWHPTRPPSRGKSVTHVSGTFCYLCVEPHTNIHALKSLKVVIASWCRELAGELMLGGKAEAKPTAETALTPLKDAIEMFLQHVRVRILGRRAHRLRSLLRLESIPH